MNDEKGNGDGLVVSNYGVRFSAARQFYEALDWTKSNRELVAETGVGLASVSHWRQLLGKEKVTKYYPRCKLWDWTLSNTEIARLEKVNVSTVYGWRVRLNQPAPEVTVGQRLDVRGYRIPGFDFSGVDWSSSTDSEIAKTLGCTRELVRQKRASLGQPKYLAWVSNFNRFKECFKGVDALDYDTAATKFKITKSTFVHYCARAGIRRLRSRRVIKKHPWPMLNFELSNKLLSRIWGIPASLVGAQRCNFNLGRARFNHWNEVAETEKIKAEAWRKETGTTDVRQSV